jgi:ABC-2 type transport system ATP-binding protein
MPHAIECRQLWKRYDGKPPVEAVRGLDLAVHEGECFGLLGPNGAGKTTTLEIIEGLLNATSGEVEVLGYRWGRHDEEVRQRSGISLQETRLSDKLTVRETVTLFRSFYKNGITADEAIRRVSLQEKVNAWVEKLSGGQKQRLAVACAIVGDPQLLFLDEPTTGLDPHSRRELWDVIGEYRSTGRTVMLTTHYMDEAERLCDRVAVIDHGRIIDVGTPADLIRKHCPERTTVIVTPDASAEALFRAIPDVDAVSCSGDAVTVRGRGDLVTNVIRCIAENRLTVSDFRTETSTLEDVFLRLTGHSIRN